MEFVDSPANEERRACHYRAWFRFVLIFGSSILFADDPDDDNDGVLDEDEEDEDTDDDGIPDDEDTDDDNDGVPDDSKWDSPIIYDGSRRLMKFASDVA